MADGVPPSEVYAALRTPGGRERAFRKMDSLRDHIRWWVEPKSAGTAWNAGLRPAPSREARRKRVPLTAKKREDGWERQVCKSARTPGTPVFRPAQPAEGRRSRV